MSESETKTPILDREVPFGATAGGETYTEIKERREHIERNRKDREQSRTEYMRSGVGKASDHVEVTTNRETIERYKDQTGAPKAVEEYDDEEREAWLRGSPPVPKEKPAAKKEEQQAAAAEGEKPNDKKRSESPADAQRAKEIREEIEKSVGKRDWWAEPEHEPAIRSFPQRRDEALAAMSPEEKAQVNRSLGDHMPLDPELRSFLVHALSRVKNLRPVYVELAKDHGLLMQMNNDWMRSTNNHQLRWSTERVIRYMLHTWDKAGSASNGAEKRERKLTQAGRAPTEATGGYSSPNDDGSPDAAWRRKDLSSEERGELYRERMNNSDREKRRKKYPRR